MFILFVALLSVVSSSSGDNDDEKVLPHWRNMVDQYSLGIIQVFSEQWDLLKTKVPEWKSKASKNVKMAKKTCIEQYPSLLIVLNDTRRRVVQHLGLYIEAFDAYLLKSYKSFQTLDWVPSSVKSLFIRKEER